MDLNEFSFENGDDLDVDIEEIIRQQTLALEELDVTSLYLTTDTSHSR
jgi:hypothetical protein